MGEGFDLLGMCPVMNGQNGLETNGEPEPQPIIPLFEHCRDCPTKLSCVQACLAVTGDNPECWLFGITDDPDFCMIFTKGELSCNLETGCCEEAPPEPICGNEIVEDGELCDPPGAQSFACEEGEVCNLTCDGCMLDRPPLP
jgi:hypothetical protein